MPSPATRDGGQRLLPVMSLMTSSAGGGSAASPPPLPLPLPHDDLLLEILLRLPPEPIYLLRASLVSKHRRRLVHDSGFLRRFRAFHGAPPLLGFLNKQPGPPLFVPTSDAFFAVPSSTMSHDSWWAIDCRHGRALLQSRNSGNLLVWDLMSGEKHCLPRPPPALDEYDTGRGFNAAVLRAAGNDEDRRSCHPFLVAMAFTHGDNAELTSTCVYSSDTDAWGDVVSAVTLEEVEMHSTALVGNTLYWLMNAGGIIELDLDTHGLRTTEVPNDMFCYYDGRILLMPAEDGGLGFATLDRHFNLLLFTRVASADGTLVWMLRRTIDLTKFLAPDVVARLRLHKFIVEAIGFAQDAGVIFIWAELSIYMLNLKSMQFDEVFQKGRYGSSIFPYTSFYNAVLTCI